MRKYLTESLLLLTVALVSSARSVESAPPRLPPLVSPASSEHHAGKVIWTDLVTPDLAGAKRFYSELFGWTYQDIPGGTRAYTIALLGGRPVAGIVQGDKPLGESRRPGWLPFIAVSDVDAARKIAVKNGATVRFEPKDISRRGRQAVFTDPDGAVFAVLSSSSGDPADLQAAPGEWIWSSLLAGHPESEAAFYQAIFGYDVFESPEENGATHLILSSDDFARASVNSLPADALRLHPHWLSFVRVVDAANTAAKAVELGGRVLVEPHESRHGGKVAVIADPMGAPVGLMEWSYADARKELK